MSTTDRTKFLRTEREAAEAQQAWHDAHVDDVERRLTVLETMTSDRENPAAVAALMGELADDVDRFGTPDQVERFDALDNF